MSHKTKTKNEANRMREFATRSEAEAFIEGVEFVNDAAISILGIREIVVNCGGGFVVEIHDEDAREDDDEQ